MTTDMHRIRRRIPCELVIAARTYKGFVRDLSPDGAFVKMDAAAVKADGVHAELRLSESTFCAPLTLQCEVTRRDVTPAMLGNMADRGVELRITEAPVGYHEAYLAAITEADEDRKPAPKADSDHVDSLAVEIEIDVADDVEVDVAVEAEVAPPPETEMSSAAEADAGCSSDLDDEFAVASREEGTTDADLPDVKEHERSEAMEPAAQAEADVPSPMPEAEAAAPHGPTDAEISAREAQKRETQATLDAMRAAVLGTTEQIDAMLVYDGDELDDLYALLEDIGVKPLRARITGPTRYDGWPHPPRVFLIQAKDALNTPLPEGAALQNVCRIAVTDSTSGVLGSMVARLGYDYLIRRPVHPEVARMLFERALYRGEEARRGQRRPAGRSAFLRVGWRTLPATLVDVSSGGARVLLRADVDLLETVKLVLPASATGGRKLSLAGRIVRKRHNEVDGVVSLALRFVEEIDAEALSAMARNLSESPLGPAPEPLAPWLDRVGGWFARRFARASRAHRAGPAADVAPPEAPSDRRRMRRSLLDTEVIRLDPETAAMQAVLIGRDLSVGGLRIDPHPETAVGDVLSLAVHDPSDGPLVLSARVTRDDGPRGMVLEFEGLTPEAAARLDRLVGDLPAAPVGRRPRVGESGRDEDGSPGVESLGDDGAEGVVLARIMTKQASPLDVQR